MEKPASRKQVTLTAQNQLLKFFASSPGSLTRDELLNEVWAIRTIRRPHGRQSHSPPAQKLEPDSANPRYS